MERVLMDDYIKIKDIAIAKDRSVESIEFLNSFKDDERKVPLTNAKIKDVAMAAINFISDNQKDNVNLDQRYYFEIFNNLK